MMESMTREELGWLIEHANLDDTSRSIMRMYYLDGRYLAYITEAVGYSPSQVYRRHRAAVVMILRLHASGALERRKE